MNLSEISGLLYAYDSSDAQDGSLASLVDRSSNGRTLSVSGSAAVNFLRASALVLLGDINSESYHP